MNAETFIEQFNATQKRAHEIKCNAGRGKMHGRNVA
jgi:hypothetical protein